MERSYFILVLLTDGCLHDMQETLDLVVELSFLPVSVIIIGIGDEDFSKMDFLDADSNILEDRWGRHAARDIVQFVLFKELIEMAQVEVAEIFLQEVPDQFVDYMVMNSILPFSKISKQTQNN
jgi:copine 5/8/9